MMRTSVGSSARHSEGSEGRAGSGGYEHATRAMRRRQILIIRCEFVIATVAAVTSNLYAPLCRSANLRQRIENLVQE